MTSDRSVDIDILTNVHVETGGECRHDHALWPCHTGIALAELARLTGDMAALRAQRDNLFRAGEHVIEAIDDMIESGTEWPDALHKGSFIDLISAIEESRPAAEASSGGREDGE